MGAAPTASTQPQPAEGERDAPLPRAAQRARWLWAGLLWASACAACFAGWRLYAFLCDDAYIAFRYISQRQLGHGYTWNAPPFLPVEGYTSFLWLLLLDAIWSVLGVEPPDSANVVSLICSFASLALVVVWVAKRWPEITPGGALPWLLFWTLALVVSNRSFLVWSSSGLETALFNLLLFWWVFLAFGLTDTPRRNAPQLCAVTLLLTLARPDGLLFWLAALGVLALLGGFRVLGWRRLALCALPLLGTPLHIGWRHDYYGSFLPNTYYAKIGAAWPAAGLRYLASFVLEHALWLWLAVSILACLRGGRGGWPARTLSNGIRGIAIGALLGHVGYYVLVVGGDHFEYRVFSHLVPLIALSFVWAAVSLSNVRAAGALCALLLVLGNVIPWTHWQLTRHLHRRSQTHNLRVAVAPALIPPFAWLARPFDALQHELIGHGIGVRHQEHKVFGISQRARYPSRAEGLALEVRQPNPVHSEITVGVAAWSLPRFHILDRLGLNDYVIARMPLPQGPRRIMAHERAAPPGYVESFMPNIRIGRDRRLIEVPRAHPLTDARIREIERDYRAMVDSAR